MKKNTLDLTPIRNLEKRQAYFGVGENEYIFVKNSKSKLLNVVIDLRVVKLAKIFFKNRNLRKKWIAASFALIFIVSLTATLLTYINGAQALVAGDGKLIYGEGAVTTPRYRDWTTSNNSFGTENSAATAAATIRHTAVEASSTRNEMISAVSTTAGGVLYVQRWNGTSWSAEWNATVGDSVLPRFDVAYEQSSGDAIVVYSGNTGTTNELRYRVWDGANWTAEQNLDPVRTSGTVDAVVLKSRSGTNNIGLAWGDTASDLSANFWDGDNNTWQGEHTVALSTNLSRVGAGTTLTNYSFDLAFESTSGELVIGWGTEGASDPSFMKRTAGAGGAWSGTTVAGTAAVEEVTDFEMVSDPNSDFIGWVNMTSESTATVASPDLEAGMWDGSTDTMTIRFNGDTACESVDPGEKNVSSGWVSSGGQYRYVYVLDDTTNGAVNWGTYDKNANSWTAQADYTTAPVPGNEHVLEKIIMNPFDQTELTYIVADLNGDLFTKRLSFDGSTYTWSGIEPSGTSPETSLSSTAGMVADFAYNITLSEFEQTGYRWFANSNSTDVGASLAALNTSATAPAEGTAFRLRMLIKVNTAGIAQSEMSLKLQYAARGVDNSCDTSFTNETYEDVSDSSGVIRYYDNATPSDNSNLTSNVNDPTNSPDNVVNQTYEESNDFSNSTAAISMGDNGMWDFSLVDNSAPANTAYCFRAVDSSGTLLSDYSVVPQITTSQPHIQSIALNAGPTSGGTPFTITGSKFEAGATVSVGGVAATKVFTVDGTTITGVAGAGSAGSQSVVVTNPSGSSTAQLSGFTHSTSLGIESKSIGSDFTAGTLTNMLSGGLKINDNLFIWTSLTASTSGGSMTAGTYYYVATAVDANGNETEKSVETKGIATTGSSSSVVLKWEPIQGAHGYKIYRTTSSGTYSSPSLIATISATTSSTTNSDITYTDTATATSSGAPPASNNTTAGVRLSLGTVPNSGNGTYSAGPNLPGSIRGGSHTIQRPNGDFLVIRGHATNSTYNYSSTENTFVFGPTLSGVANFGAHSIERPDGTFLIYSAGGTAVTSIYDPVANTMSAGPTAPVNLGGGANSFPIGDGAFLTIAGNASANTIIYDPVANSFTNGPTVVGSTSNNVMNGAHSYKRPDGKYFVITCTTASTTIYDPALNSFSAGPALTTACDDGTTSIVRPNGMLLIIIGHDSPNPTGSTTTNNYDPYTNTITNGPVLPVGATQGTTPLQRPDGKYTILHGGDGVANGSTYDPIANSFTSGPTPPSYVYEGGHAFQRPDGKYVILRGHSNTTSMIYDAGWYAGNTGDGGTVGVWESENLNPGTLTSWEKIGFVKTKDGNIQSTTTDRTFTSLADGGISTGQFNDSVIGTNGLPIVSYWDQTNGDLEVYSCSNAACTSGSNVTISDPAGDVWGRETSIVIGSDGYPVIAHYNSTDGDIAITKCGNADCSSNTTTKFPNAQVAGDVRVDIVIGADDLPVLGYAQFDGSESDPVISQCTTTACTALTTTVLNDGTDNSGRYGSITIGSDDLPVYAYRNTTETGLAVAKCTNASCTTYGIQLAYDDPSGFQNGYDTSIIISPDGYPLISHYITSTQDLITTKCATHNCTQGSNTTTQHTTSLSYGLWTSMALGTDNLPIIASWRDTASSTVADSLIITRCLNDACTSVSSPLEFKLGRVAEYMSLIIGSDGYPFITWWDYNAGADNNLAFLKCADITCGLTSSDTIGLIEVKTATTSGGLASAAYREVSSGDSIGAGVGEVWLKIKVTFTRPVPDWSDSLAIEDNSAGGANVWNCERAYGRYFAMPTMESITASYNTAGGGGSAPTEDQFMRHGSYFSGGIEQPYYLD